MKLAGPNRDAERAAEKQHRKDERQTARHSERAQKKAASQAAEAQGHPIETQQLLRLLLRGRRAVFPPSSLIAAARARARAFAEVSASYRADTQMGESDVIVHVDGVALCAPATFAAKLKLPWSHIQSVREVAVGGVMLDVGANIGQTCVPRILLGDFQAIYAAEPEPANYARLRATIRANSVDGFVLPDRVAIGSRDGLLRFHVGYYRSHRAAAAGDVEAVDVDCLTLDSWIERLGIDADTISYVKVDTNGFETDVLRGAERLLRRSLAVWQLEVAPAFMLDTTLDDLCGEIRRRFTHFTDLGGPTSHRPRPTTDLPAALDYLQTGERSRGGKLPQTDLLCFHTPTPSALPVAER